MHLSERLVVQNGILFMGLRPRSSSSSITRGSVQILIVMYSINVFLTFSLSQLGMCLHWLKSPAPASGQEADHQPHWPPDVPVHPGRDDRGIKFKEGGWITLIITASVVAVCLLIRRHYNRVKAMMSGSTTSWPRSRQMTGKPKAAVRNMTEPTAVLFVRNFGGLGIHSFLNIHRIFPHYFKNFIFVSVGVVDWKNFKGAEEVKNLESHLADELKKYVRMANDFGFYAESIQSVDVDTLEFVEERSEEIQKKYNKAVFFVGKLVFEEENMFTRFLHNQTAFSIQRILQFKGIPSIVLPIRVIKTVK